jgi:light-regulated signal transduction histidine kinase (bacteriophytochrome)
MNAKEVAPQERGLQFFGKISATVTHDLKNVLAIINEKAGLLEDFSQMAQRGMPVDMERIDTVTAQVKGQVQRADQIIRRFNSFAHTADHPIAPIDLNACLLTLVQLAQRLLAKIDIKVAVHTVSDPVIVTTRPLMAQELIWAGIQWGGGLCVDGGEISIAAATCNQGACVQIGQLMNLPAEDGCASLISTTETLRQNLAAEIRAAPDTNMIEIRFASLHL